MASPPNVSESFDMDAPASAFFPPVSPEEFAVLPHDDQGPHLVAATWVLISLASLFLGLRVYCKIARGSRLWWDDHILIAAWLCLLVSGCLITVNVAVGGYGKHVWDVGVNYTIGTIIKTFLRININSTFTITASVWSKTSFALTLLRLSEGWMKKLVWVIIISMNLVMGIAALIPWIYCKPMSAAWNFLEQGPGICWSFEITVIYNTFATALSAAMDIILALLPWKIVWGLQMKRIEKIGVGIAMSCGVFAGAVTIVKAVKTPQVSTFDPAKSTDLTIWVITEIAVTIIAASIPVLRVLIRDVHSTARRYYVSRGSGKDSRLTTDKSATGGSLYGGRSRATATVASMNGPTAPRSPDNWSDKSILESAAPTGRIKQTHEIKVEYGVDKYDLSSEYEMGPVGHRS